MLSPIITLMSAAAVKAGKGLMRDFGEVDQLQISRKSTANYVTSADLRTEKLLQKELKAARPGFGFLLEEGGEVAGRDDSHRWIIDPLDGTSNFIHAISYFCISIALEKREHGKSEIIAGVVFDPIHNELFAAEKNKGAFVNNRRMAVSSREQLEEAMLVSGNPRSALANQPAALKLFESISTQGGTIRCFGATALDLANLAAGRIDACWYHTMKPWDVAAGLLLVKEAGGVVSDLQGQPADSYSTSLLASSQKLSSSMQTLLKSAA